MRIGWIVIIIAAFYLAAAAMFWPVEKKILPQRSTPGLSEYAPAVVQFSDTSINVRIPLTVNAQERGLGGRTQLTDREGMLWLYDPPQLASFWMKGMRLPLDFLWFSDERVTEITADVPPPENEVAKLPIYQSAQPVSGMLEVPAGYAARHQIQVGDSIRVDR